MMDYTTTIILFFSKVWASVLFIINVFLFVFINNSLLPAGIEISIGRLSFTIVGFSGLFFHFDILSWKLVANVDSCVIQTFRVTNKPGSSDDTGKSSTILNVKFLQYLLPTCQINILNFHCSQDGEDSSVQLHLRNFSFHLLRTTELRMMISASSISASLVSDCVSLDLIEVCNVRVDVQGSNRRLTCQQVIVYFALQAIDEILKSFNDFDSTLLLSRDKHKYNCNNNSFLNLELGECQLIAVSKSNSNIDPVKILAISVYIQRSSQLKGDNHLESIVSFELKCRTNATGETEPNFCGVVFCWKRKIIVSKLTQIVESTEFAWSINCQQFDFLIPVELVICLIYISNEVLHKIRVMGCQKIDFENDSNKMNNLTIVNQGTLVCNFRIGTIDQENATITCLSFSKIFAPSTNLGSTLEVSIYNTLFDVYPIGHGPGGSLSVLQVPLFTTTFRIPPNSHLINSQLIADHLMGCELFNIAEYLHNESSSPMIQCSIIIDQICVSLCSESLRRIAEVFSLFTSVSLPFTKLEKQYRRVFWTPKQLQTSPVEVTWSIRRVSVTYASFTSSHDFIIKNIRGLYYKLANLFEYCEVSVSGITLCDSTSQSKAFVIGIEMTDFHSEEVMKSVFLSKPCLSWHNNRVIAFLKTSTTCLNLRTCDLILDPLLISQFQSSIYSAQVSYVQSFRRFARNTELLILPVYDEEALFELQYPSTACVVSISRQTVHLSYLNQPIGVLLMTDIECGYVKNTLSATQFVCTISQICLQDTSLDSSRFKNIITSKTSVKTSVCFQLTHLKDSVNTQLVFNNIQIIYLQRSVMTLLSFFKDHVLRHEEKYHNISSPINELFIINRSPKRSYLWIELQASVVLLPINSCSFDSLVFKFPILSFSPNGSSFNLRNKAGGMIVPSELPRLKKLVYGEITIDDVGTDWVYSSYKDLFTDNSSRCDDVTSYLIELRNCQIGSTLSSNQIAESLNICCILSLIPTCQNTPSMYSAVFDSLRFSDDKKHKRYTTIFDITGSEIDWRVTRSQYLTIVYVIQQNFHEFMQIIPQVSAPPLRFVDLKDSIFGMRSIDFMTPIQSVVEVFIANGRIAFIEEDIEFLLSEDNLRNLGSQEFHFPFVATPRKIPPKHADCVAIVMFECIEFIFWRHHYGGGNNMEVCCESFYILEDHVNQNKFDLLSLSPEKIIFCPSYFYHQVSPLEGNIIPTSVRYVQHGMGNLRRCLIYLFDSVIISQLSNLSQIISFFVGPIFLTSRREILLEQSATETIITYRACMDVELYATNIIISVPTHINFEEKNATCYTVNLQIPSLCYTHLWRGFLETGPGIVDISVNMNARKIFISPRSFILDDEAICYPFQLQFRRSTVVVSSELSWREDSHILQGIVTFEQFDFQNARRLNESSRVHKQVWVKVSSFSKDSETIKEPIVVSISIPDLQVILGGIHYLKEDLNRIPRRSVEDMFSFLCTCFDDIRHLPRLKTYFASTIVNPSTKIRQSVEVIGSVTSQLLLNFKRNLNKEAVFAHITISNAHFSNILADPSFQLTGSLDLQLSVKNLITNYFEPIVENFGVQVASGLISDDGSSNSTKFEISLHPVDLNCAINPLNYLLFNVAQKDSISCLNSKNLIFRIENDFGIDARCTLYLGEASFSSVLIDSNQSVSLPCYHTADHAFAEVFMEISFRLRNVEYKTSCVRFEDCVINALPSVCSDHYDSAIYLQIFAKHLELEGIRHIIFSSAAVIRNELDLTVEVMLMRKDEIMPPLVKCLRTQESWNLPVHFIWSKTSISLRIFQDSFKEPWECCISDYEELFQLLQYSQNTPVTLPICISYLNLNSDNYEQRHQLPCKFAFSISNIDDSTNQTLTNSIFYRLGAQFGKKRKNIFTPINLSISASLYLSNQLCQPLLYKMTSLNSSSQILCCGHLLPGWTLPMHFSGMEGVLYLRMLNYKWSTPVIFERSSKKYRQLETTLSSLGLIYDDKDIWLPQLTLCIRIDDDRVSISCPYWISNLSELALVCKVPSMVLNDEQSFLPLPSATKGNADSLLTSPARRRTAHNDKVVDTRTIDISVYLVGSYCHFTTLRISKSSLFGDVLKLINYKNYQLSPNFVVYNITPWKLLPSLMESGEESWLFDFVKFLMMQTYSTLQETLEATDDKSIILFLHYTELQLLSQLSNTMNSKSELADSSFFGISQVSPKTKFVEYEGDVPFYQGKTLMGSEPKIRLTVKGWTEWSKPVSLQPFIDLLESYSQPLFLRSDSFTRDCYDLMTSIQGAKECSVDSKVLLIHSYLFIHSKLPFNIYVRQIVLSASGVLNDVGPILQIQPGQRIHFHHSLRSSTSTQVVQFSANAECHKYAADSQVWSRELSICLLGESACKIRNPNIVMNVVTENVTSNLVTKLELFNSLWPPYRIENKTDFKVRYAQILDQQDQCGWDFLNEQDVTTYSWDFSFNYCFRLMNLRIAFHGTSWINVDVPLNEIGFSRDICLVRPVPEMSHPIYEGAVEYYDDATSWTSAYCVLLSTSIILFLDSTCTVVIDVINLRTPCITNNASQHYEFAAIDSFKGKVDWEFIDLFSLRLTDFYRVNADSLNNDEFWDVNHIRMLILGALDSVQFFQKYQYNSGEYHSVDDELKVTRSTLSDLLITGISPDELLHFVSSVEVPQDIFIQGLQAIGIAHTETETLKILADMEKLNYLKQLGSHSFNTTSTFLIFVPPSLASNTQCSSNAFTIKSFEKNISLRCDATFISKWILSIRMCIEKLWIATLTQTSTVPVLTKDDLQIHVNLNVVAVGPTKVLLITEMTRMGKEENCGSTPQKLIELSLRMPFLGISIVDSAPEEVFAVILKDVLLEFVQYSDHSLVQGSIGDLQIENQILNAFFPTVLSPKKVLMDEKLRVQFNLTKVDESMLDSDLPFILLTLKSKNAGPRTLVSSENTVMQNIVFFEFFTLWMAPLEVRVDEESIVRLLRCLCSVDKSKLQDVLKLKWTHESNLNIVVEPNSIPQSRRIFVDFFHIHPMEVDLSIKPTPGFVYDPTDLRIFSNIFKIEQCKIQVNCLIINRLNGKVSDIKLALSNHYYDGLFGKVYALLGHTDVAEATVGIITNISSGVYDFFYQPIDGLLGEDKSFLEGVARGSKSLVSKTVVGTSGFTSKITGGIGYSISILSFDKVYQLQRSRNRLKPARSFVDGLQLGSKEFSTSLLEGVAGIITQPYHGWKKEGSLGFGKGLAKGLIGVAVKPTAGLFDFASRAAEGIRYSSGMHSVSMYQIDLQYIKYSPNRLPRVFGPRNELIPYDYDQAVIQFIVNNVLKCEHQERAKMIFNLKFIRRISSSFAYRECNGYLRDTNVLLVILPNKLLLMDLTVRSNSIGISLHWSCPVSSIESFYSDANGDLVLVCKQEVSCGYLKPFSWRLDCPIVHSRRLTDYLTALPFVQSLCLEYAFPLPLSASNEKQQSFAAKRKDSGLFNVLNEGKSYMYVLLEGGLLYEYSSGVSNIDAQSLLIIDNNKPHQYSVISSSFPAKSLMQWMHTPDIDDDILTLNSIIPLANMTILGPDIENGKYCLITLRGYTMKSKFPFLTRDMKDSGRLKLECRDSITLLFNSEELACEWKSLLATACQNCNYQSLRLTSNELVIPYGGGAVDMMTAESVKLQIGTLLYDNNES